MSRRVRLWVSIVTLLLVAPEFSLAAQAPPPPLPADLLFVTSSVPGGNYPRDTIMRVDAKTLEITPFYVDDAAFDALPISWSPQGDLLAIYRMMPAIDEALTLFPRQLCILDRAGVLQRCLDDHPPMHWGGFPETWKYPYPVAWGRGGQTVYFAAEYPTNDSIFGFGRHLVEASVLTGETLRIIYDYPDPWPVAPSPTLNQVMVGFSDAWQGPDTPTFILDLTTRVQLDIPNLMPDDTGLYWTCQTFSPSGRYIAVTAHYNVTRYAPELVPPDDYRNGEGGLLLLMDMQGSIQHLVAEPEGSPAVMWYVQCPYWLPDEQAILFYAWHPDRRSLMRYSLVDRQTTTLYEINFEPGRKSYVYAPFIPSPDGTHVALIVSDAPYGYDDFLVAVLYPDGEIRRIPNDYRSSLYPLWVPPIPD